MTTRLFSHHLHLRCWATKYTDVALSATRSNSNSSLGDLLIRVRVLLPNSKQGPSTRINQNLTVLNQKRTFSYYTASGGGGDGGGVGMNSSRNLRAFPSYTIYGETCVLQMKCIMPKFKNVGQDGNIIAVSQQGRMIFEFIPASQSGIQWQRGISFALKPEEMGLLINQIPIYPVSFTRTLFADVQNVGDGNGMDGGRYDMVSDDDSVFKTMTVRPVDGAAISFQIDYIKNGIGGQVPPLNSTERNYECAPLDLNVQAGEWECLKLTAQKAIPLLIGWESLMEVAMKDAFVSRSS